MQANSVNASIPEQSSVVIAPCLGPMKDEVLVSAAKSGDAVAFAELYERHSKKVLSRIYRITTNREDAEDALQDAVLRAFVYVKSFEGRSTFASWLTRIATNPALVVSSKRLTGTEISIEQLSERSENHLGTAGPRRISGELLRAAAKRRTIAECDSTAVCIFLEAVELQQAEECSTGQVAEEFGTSESAAKSRLMRARKVLAPASFRFADEDSSRACVSQWASSSRIVSRAASAAQGGGTQV